MHNNRKDLDQQQHTDDQLILVFLVEVVEYIHYPAFVFIVNAFGYKHAVLLVVGLKVIHLSINHNLPAFLHPFNFMQGETQVKQCF